MLHGARQQARSGPEPVVSSMHPSHGASIHLLRPRMTAFLVPCTPSARLPLIDRSFLPPDGAERWRCPAGARRAPTKRSARRGLVGPPANAAKRIAVEKASSLPFETRTENHAGFWRLSRRLGWGERSRATIQDFSLRVSAVGKIRVPRAALRRARPAWAPQSAASKFRGPGSLHRSVGVSRGCLGRPAPRRPRGASLRARRL